MTTETTSPETSLRDDLVAAMQQVTEAQGGDAAARDDGAPVDAGATDPGSSADAAAAARARDERGRFARTGEGGTEASAAPAAAAPAGAPAPAVSAPAPGPDDVAPPQNLPADLRASWAAWPPEARRYIASREAEVHKGFTRMDEDRTFGKQVRDAVTPYMATISAEGGDPVSAFKVFLDTASRLRGASPEQKADLAVEIFRRHGISPQLVFQRLTQAPAQQPAQQHYAPPAPPAITQEHIQGLVRQQLEAERISTDIAAFAADPSHTHFEQVKPVMAALLQSGHATSLQDAYDRAVWADPGLRQTVLAAQQQTAEGERARQAAQKAEAARRAGASVNGTPGTVVPAAPPDRSLREEIRANLRASAH